MSFLKSLRGRSRSHSPAAEVRDRRRRTSSRSRSRRGSMRSPPRRYERSRCRLHCGPHRKAVRRLRGTRSPPPREGARGRILLHNRPTGWEPPRAPALATTWPFFHWTTPSPTTCVPPPISISICAELAGAIEGGSRGAQIGDLIRSDGNEFR